MLAPLAGAIGASSRPTTSSPTCEGVRPARSLGLALAQTPKPWDLPHKEILEATLQAPGNTRAMIRSRAMHLLKNENCSYYIDWEIIGAEGGNSLHLLNPFDAGSKEADSWIQLLAETRSRAPKRGKVSA